MTVWIVSLTAFCILILVLKRLKLKWLEHILDEHVMNFLISAFATVTGVMLAIVLTNYDISKQEKTFVKSMLETAYRDVWEARSEKNMYFDLLSDPNLLASAVKEVPLSLPYSVEYLAANETFKRVVDPISSIALQNALFGIKSTSQRINQYEVPNTDGADLDEDQSAAYYDEIMDISYEKILRILYITNEYVEGRIDDYQVEVLRRAIDELAVIRLYNRHGLTIDKTAFPSYYIALETESVKKIMKRVELPPYLSLDPSKYDAFPTQDFQRMGISITDYCKEYGLVFIPFATTESE